jgi:peroxiredoxin (alkyl hydroperoxide reductase subunit C)
MIGKKVADFSVQAYVDGDFVEVTQADILGKWSIFFFYPADFTFVCPTELEDLADRYQDFKKIGCEIYSVSTDTHFTHMAWAQHSPAIGKVKYPMLADPNHTISKDFGVLTEGSGLALRGTFIINPEGEIVAYEVHSLGIGRNSAELLRKVQAAQYVAEGGGEVCPAGWQPGEDALMPAKDLVGKI